MAGRTTSNATSFTSNRKVYEGTSRRAQTTGGYAIANGQHQSQTRMQAYLDEPTKDGNRLVMLPDQFGQATGTVQHATEAMKKRLDDIMKELEKKPKAT